MSLAAEGDNVDERQKQLFAEYELVGEDEIRLRMNSSAYTPVDRIDMQTWLNIKESKRTRDLQEKTAWILRLTLVIVILTLILVALTVFPIRTQDVDIHSHNDAPHNDEKHH
jgi:hypothetical protein